MVLTAKSYKSKAVKIIKDDLKGRKEWSEKRKKKVAKKNKTHSPFFEYALVMKTTSS